MRSPGESGGTSLGKRFGIINSSKQLLLHPTLQLFTIFVSVAVLGFCEAAHGTAFSSRIGRFYYSCLICASGLAKPRNGP